MAELVDAHDSKSCGLTAMRVRFSPSAYENLQTWRLEIVYKNIIGVVGTEIKTTSLPKTPNYDKINTVPD